jgi:hypothetical protein
MPSKEHELEFETVTAKLCAWRKEIMVEFRSPKTHDKAIQLKRQLDAAVLCLEFCQRHQIRPNSEVVVLPDTQTQTPLSNYRVLEDHETDKREHWVEVEVNGEPLQLYPGDIIIS